MSCLSFCFHDCWVLNANAHRSSDPGAGIPVIHVELVAALTGIVSESTLLSPPPIGPVWGIKEGQMACLTSSWHRFSNGVSAFREPRVSRKYSAFDRFSSCSVPRSLSEKR